MPSRRDCVDGAAGRNGRKPEEVEEDVADMLGRADGYEHDGEDYQNALGRAGLEMMQEQLERNRLASRAAMMDARKDIARRAYYRRTVEEIEKRFPKYGVEGGRLAIEAKLVGVNLPFFKNRASVDAQFMALRKQIVGGFELALEKSHAGDLVKMFASRQIEKDWTDELFQLWRGKRGAPGITKNPQALAIAKAIMEAQKDSIAQVNAEGGWVRTYSGYITRTSHDPDAIRRAGPEKWVYDTFDRIDLKRTFGTTDRLKVMDALRQMWAPMADGDHFDYGVIRDDPMFPNLARRASASRELHFKSAEDWRAYNEKYGVADPTQTVVRALGDAARRVALMKEFGTKPAAAFEGDINYWKSWTQGESRALSEKLEKLQREFGEKPSDPLIAARIAETEAQAQRASLKFGDFNKWESALRNRFAQIDGSAMRPVNRGWANATARVMAINRMSKLGRVILTHFASLPTKAAEANYWGISFGERYASMFRGLTRGSQGSVKREVLNHFLVANESRLGQMMNQYDVADAPRGALASCESTFFRLTGVSSVLENQRGDAEAMFAAHVGSKQGMAWADIGRQEQRVLLGFGIGESEWKALAGVEWSKPGDGRTYLFPSDAMKLTDDQIRAYINSMPRAVAKTIGPEEVAKARRDLALSIATAYSDRAGFAIPMPDARTRAMMFGKNFEPGTPINLALRMIYQFKMWPAAMITRAWGREIYGRAGDPALGRISGLVELAVGAAIFGTASEVVRKEIQGIDGIGYLAQHPVSAILSGLQRSGMGTLLGDFLIGQFDRHNMLASADILGPTFGQIDTLMDLVHGGGDNNRHPWRTRAADTLRLARDNLPFMNLWMTGVFMNYLVWYRLQDWINPGYLQRMEKRMQQNQGEKFWLSPQNPGRSLQRLAG